MNYKSIIIPERDDYMLEMEKRAREEYIPIIRPEVGQFLKVLIEIKRPGLILEIGTAIGYSTIWLAKAAGRGTEIVTIEKDEEKAKEALNNFKHYQLDKSINLKIGDALDIIPYLKRKFDLVFIDAAKGQYIYFLEYILDLLPVGGIIIADNVLYRGYVEKEGKIKHKRRTIVNNLREYLDKISNHSLLDSTIVPLGDGLAISVRRG